jgi:hypothetical protein
LPILASATCRDAAEGGVMPDQGALVTVRRHPNSKANRVTVPVSMIESLEWTYYPGPVSVSDIVLQGKLPVTALSLDQRAAWIKGIEWFRSERRKPPDSYVKVFVLQRDNRGSDVYRQLSALADAREKGE